MIRFIYRKLNINGEIGENYISLLKDDIEVRFNGMKHVNNDMKEFYKRYGTNIKMTEIALK